MKLITNQYPAILTEMREVFFKILRLIYFVTDLNAAWPPQCIDQSIDFPPELTSPGLSVLTKT